MDKSFLKVAVSTGLAAAKIAGRIMLRHLGKLDSKKIAKKGISDYVTEVDYICEEAIKKIIRKKFPEHAILCEENGLTKGASRYTWIIDPLDGTTNYLHGYPMFSVSIALAEGEEIILGVIFDPIRNELFYASKEKGAWLNGCKIKVSGQTKFADSLIATGFPFRHKKVLDTYLKSFREIFLHCGGIRRAGSAALDLAYTACGRVEGFWEYGLSSWDIAAGSIIIKEADGKISDFSGKLDYLKTGCVVAGNSVVHRNLVAITKKIF